MQREWNDISIKFVSTKTGKTGPVAQVQVWKDKLLFTDQVHLYSEKSRAAFVHHATSTATDLDPHEVSAWLNECAGEMESDGTPGDAPSDSSEGSPDGLYWNKPSGEAVRLANFTASIKSMVVRDDGIEEDVVLELDTNHKGVDRTVSVGASEFASMNWPIGKIAPDAVVFPQMKERAKVAIQLASSGIEERRIYTHTGWRKVDDQWFYLHSGGAIGADGHTEEVRVELPDGMQDFSLPQPPNGDALRESVEASLSVLDVGPESITACLLGAVFRAPLSEIRHSDLSAFLEGRTGSKKSCLTALAQAHFGCAFSYDRLPAGWNGTAKSLEAKAALAKDAVLVVDDFKPKGTQAEVANLHSGADDLLRAQANQQGRSRLNSDSGVGKQYTPRGLIVSSGEDVPKGSSLQGRMMLLSVEPDAVDVERLSQCQEWAREGLFANAMSAYLQWLAPQLDSLRDGIDSEFEKLRDRVDATDGLNAHPRTPSNTAHLLMGWDFFLRFLKDRSVLVESDIQSLRRRVEAAVLEAGRNQPGATEELDDDQRFLVYVASALRGGYAHLERLEGGAPQNPGDWGWRSNGFSPESRGPRLGWVDDDYVYLVPDLVYQAAQRSARATGENLGTTQKILWKRLAESGVSTGNDTGRNTSRITVDGKQQRVLRIPRERLPV